MEIDHEIHEKHEMAKTGEIVLFDRVLVILERAFYLVFENRLEILSPVGRESADNEKLFLMGRELEKMSNHEIHERHEKKPL